jgi:DNA (cytosine-5)-methyltransferase 1
MENVRNFVKADDGMVLKMAVRSLLETGYSCSVCILQAGQFGVPKSRKRLFLIAAAPGEQLPELPKPLHTFWKSGLSEQKFSVDGHIFEGYRYWPGGSTSAPYKHISVKEAISDLPIINNGNYYRTPPRSAYQSMLRKKDSTVKDHEIRTIKRLAQLRINLIPTFAGADWRDLPNIETKLDDGTPVPKLIYKYKDAEGKMRGVCRCADKKRKCKPRCRQTKTIIPWYLPHTADRHTQWAGSFGRIDPDGYFPTTLTHPKPTGKQGTVIHYNQNRVISVRECARSQGFPDWYEFHGSVDDKYRQIGNAVPPPLSRAVGFELKNVFC